MPWNREIGYLIFVVVLPTILFSLQIYLYWKARRWMTRHTRAGRGAKSVLLALFLIFNLSLVAVITIRPDARTFPGWFIIVGVYPFYLWYASTFFLGLVLGLWDLVALILRLGAKAAQLLSPVKAWVERLQATPGFADFDLHRRAFLRQGAYGVAAVTIAGSSYGMFIGRHEHDITHEVFSLEGLPNEFDGFTIGLISDIHSGLFMLPEEMREYVKIVNDLGTDLIAIPGDFVSGRVDEVYPFAEVFSGLTAPFGMYGVLGNHDFYTGHPEKIASEVDHAGIRILRNENLEIQRNGARITLVGVDDVGRNERAPIELDKALSGSPESQSRILLCHRPYYLQEISARRIPLVLSGHTHGGQIVLGKFGRNVITPAAIASPYIWGRYQLGVSQMYVSRGVGTVGLPIRLNCPPEVTKITLRAE